MCTRLNAHFSNSKKSCADKSPAKLYSHTHTHARTRSRKSGTEIQLDLKIASEKERQSRRAATSERKYHKSMFAHSSRCWNFSTLQRKSGKKTSKLNKNKNKYNINDLDFDVVVFFSLIRLYSVYIVFFFSSPFWYVCCVLAIGLDLDIGFGKKTTKKNTEYRYSEINLQTNYLCYER